MFAIVAPCGTVLHRKPCLLLQVAGGQDSKASCCSKAATRYTGTRTVGSRYAGLAASSCLFCVCECVCVCVCVCMCVVGKTRIGAGLTLPCRFGASRWNQRWCPHGLRRSHPQKMHLPRQRLQSCLMAVLPQRYSYRVVHSASVM